MDAHSLLVILYPGIQDLAFVPTSFGVAFDVAASAISSNEDAIRIGMDDAGFRLCMTLSMGMVTRCAVR